MGMSTHIIGFVPPDEKFVKMETIWKACQSGGIEIPEEVFNFFEHTDPDPRGFSVDIPAQEWSNDHSSGYEIDVSKIPEKVKFIRFCNSW